MHTNMIRPASVRAPLERKDDSGTGGDGGKSTKDVLNEFMRGWEEFKTTNDDRLKKVEKKTSVDILTEEKLERINRTLDSVEGMNQKLTTLEAKTAELAELDKRFDHIETMLKRTGSGNDDGESKAEKCSMWARAVVDAHTVGVPNLSEKQQNVIRAVQDEYKALNVGTDTQGGYLAPTEMVREIIKQIVEISPVRSLARVRNTSFKAMEIPTRTGTGSARRVHETGTKTATDEPTYGLEEITLPEAYALIDITNQMLEDSAFDIVNEIRMDASEQFAVLEGSEFVSGTGVGSMQGILTNSSVEENVSGSAATIADTDGQADGLLTLKYALKSGYGNNARWIMNRKTIGSVRKLKDGNNNYVWMPGLANGAPNTIDGDPYVEVPDMPNEGAGAYPIAYGDFRRAFTLADRISMEMLRDPYTQATGGKVRFIFRRRTGGKVTLAEAIRKLKCST